MDKRRLYIYGLPIMPFLVAAIFAVFHYFFGAADAQDGLYYTALFLLSVPGMLLFSVIAMRTCSKNGWFFGYLLTLFKIIVVLNILVMPLFLIFNQYWIVFTMILMAVEFRRLKNLDRENSAIE